MSRDEFKEFAENDFELLEDEEWDNYSLKNGAYKSIFKCITLIFLKFYL